MKFGYTIIYVSDVASSLAFGSPSHQVISNAYLNNFRAAPIIQISKAYHYEWRRALDLEQRRYLLPHTI